VKNDVSIAAAGSAQFALLLVLINYT